MWGLFELLKFSFSSIFWGILITVVCMALFFFLIRGWYRNAVFTPISYVIGIILFLLLAFQCTMIVGAIKIIRISPYYEAQIQHIKIIRISPYYEAQIQQMVNSHFPSDREVSKQESEQVIDWLVTEYPILQHYFDTGEFTGYTAQQLPAVMGAEIRSFLRFYILRRLLWCLGFVIVGAVLVIRSIAKEYERKHSNSSRYTRHSSHSMSRRRF